MLELDHIFVCVPDEIYITDIPSEFGLNLSARRIHPGQGTANRCASSKIELEWDLGKEQEILDFRSMLPMSIRW